MTSDFPELTYTRYLGPDPVDSNFQRVPPTKPDTSSDPMSPEGRSFIYWVVGIVVFLAFLSVLFLLGLMLLVRKKRLRETTDDKSAEESIEITELLDRSRRRVEEGPKGAELTEELSGSGRSKYASAAAAAVGGSSTVRTGSTGRTARPDRRTPKDTNMPSTAEPTGRRYRDSARSVPASSPPRSSVSSASTRTSWRNSATESWNDDYDDHDDGGRYDDGLRTERSNNSGMSRQSRTSSLTSSSRYTPSPASRGSSSRARPIHGGLDSPASMELAEERRVRNESVRDRPTRGVYSGRSNVSNSRSTVRAGPSRGNTNGTGGKHRDSIV